MCNYCDTQVAVAGTNLDRVIKAEKVAQQGYSGYDSTQHCMRLANTMCEAYVENQSAETLRNMALGFAIAINRLIALEQIYGVSTP
jgi:hypothetical protein